VFCECVIEANERQAPGLSSSKPHTFFLAEVTKINTLTINSNTRISLNSNHLLIARLYYF